MDERYPVIVRQVGLANNGKSRKVTQDWEANLERMVREMVDRQLQRLGPWEMAPAMILERSSVNALTLAGEVL